MNKLWIGQNQKTNFNYTMTMKQLRHYEDNE